MDFGQLSAEIARLDKAERAQNAAKLIARICGPPNVHYTRRTCTYAELSRMLGYYAPDVGRRGTTIISDWARGARAPSRNNLRLLTWLASGKLRIEFEGERTDRRLNGDCVLRLFRDGDCVLEMRQERHRWIIDIRDKNPRELAVYSKPWQSLFKCAREIVEGVDTTSSG